MVYERVRAAVRNETFDCEGVSYGVPMMPEDEESLRRAADSLADVLGKPAWLAEVVGVLREDGRTMEIEVRVQPGHPRPLLPPRWHGYRIRVEDGGGR